MVWLKTARASHRVTLRRLADPFLALWLRASDHRRWVRNAFVGEGGQIANQRAVTHIPVLQHFAISIFHAFTGNRDPGTRTAVTFIGNGAGITIVTIRLVVLEIAATKTVTAVIRAGVAVIALNW